MAITKIQSGAIPADAIDTTHIGDVGADKITGQVVSSQISDLNVTHAKLHTTMDLSSKTVTLPTLSTLNITGNVLVGTIDTNVANNSGSGNDGVNIHPDSIRIARTDGDMLLLNRLNSDGDIIKFLKDGATVGSIGSNSASGTPVLDISTHSSSGIMRMLTSGAERMRITSSGSVRVGLDDPTAGITASDDYNDPDNYNLVLPAARTTGEKRGIGFVDSGNINSAILGVDEGTGGAQGLSFYTGTGSSITERLRIKSDGNVGIGTTSPGQMLHIAGSSPQIMLEDTDASGTPYSKISGVNGHIYLQADEGNELASTAIHFKVDAQEYMTLDHTGMLNLKNYGTNAGWEGASSIPSLAINQSDAHRGIALRTVGNSNVGPTVSLERTRGSGAQTQHADYLGSIRFHGTSGSHMPRVAAGIEAQQRGSVIAGYAPGRLKFMTSSTTATHNGQNPSTGAYTAKAVINPGGDQLINGQFNYHVISGTSAPNVAFQYDFYRATYGHPMKITTAISHWNGGYMSYKEQWIWGFNTAMSNRTVDEYNGGNGSWTISFPTNDIVRVRMNGDASYGYGSGWFIKLEGNLRREYTTA